MNNSDNINDLLERITQKIKDITTFVPKVGVFGNSGVGKSSLCNSLFGHDVAPISDVEACTRQPQEIFVPHLKGGISLIDVPGIGEDPSRQREYTALYRSLVPTLDLILWAIKADDRSYASALETYHRLKADGNMPPVIFVITQTDKTNDMEDWDFENYQPGGQQIHNILLKENDVSARFNVSTNYIISVAISKKGRQYNMNNLIRKIVEILPNEKKYSFVREAREELVDDEVVEQAERGLWNSVVDFVGRDNFEKVKNVAIKVATTVGLKYIGKVTGWASVLLKKW